MSMFKKGQANQTAREDIDNRIAQRSIEDVDLEVIWSDIKNFVTTKVQQGELSGIYMIPKLSIESNYGYDEILFRFNFEESAHPNWWGYNYAGLQEVGLADQGPLNTFLQGELNTDLGQFMEDMKENLRQEGRI